ncbi:MFS transporter [Cohnella faecalis]|uniref:MFS transporter n=1 Tax=Cohnella faecalis TaxID=2315694 RepID=A0A398CEH2_9BACL|nr:MFS transporter [Cohnella faecalis]RIE01103.1 MFS transporter [Cohnella faecalis]
MTKGLVKVLCFGLMAFLGFYLSAFQRMLDYIAQDYSLSKVLMGFTATAHFVGILCGSLATGERSDRFGRKKVIGSGCLFFLLGLLVIWLAPAAYAVLVGIFLTGVGFGILSGSISTLLTDFEEGDANRVLNISQMFFSIGTVIGPFMAVAAMEYADDWKLIYGLSFLLILFFSFLFLKYPYPRRSVADATEETYTSLLLKQKRFLLLGLSILMYVGIESGMGFWITTYIRESGSTSAWYASAVLSAFWGGTIVGRYAVSRFSIKLHEIVVISALLSAAFLLVIVLSGSAAASFCAMFGVGLGFAGIWPLIMALARAYYPKYTGTAFGLLMACCALGGIFIPLAMGIIGKAVGMNAALSFGFVPILIIVCIHLYLKRTSIL